MPTSPILVFSGLHALELAVIELGIEAALRQQGVVVALLHDVAILHHKDDIGLTDGGQAVGHDKAGAALHHPGKGSLNAHLGAGVDGGGRLVQNQHGGQAEHHAGDAEQLLLALTDVAAVLGDDGERARALRGGRGVLLAQRGGLGDNVELQANTIATVLAQRMGASYRQLYVPDSVSEEILNSILAEDTGVKAVVDIIKQADILVHGVGQAAVMARHRRMAPEFIQKLLDDGAVGEAFGQYCALDGRQVYMTNNAGLMLQDLPKIGTVIGVAGGRSKTEAILSVIRASRQDILVTDEAAAHCIAEMLED